MKSQKNTVNLPLKLAIVATGKRQRIIATRARIPEVRLSLIVCGKATPREHEKQAIAKAVKRPVENLFPDPLAVMEASS